LRSRNVSIFCFLCLSVSPLAKQKRSQHLATCWMLCSGDVLLIACARMLTRDPRGRDRLSRGPQPLDSLTACGVPPRRARVGRMQKTRRDEPGGFSVLATSYSRMAYRHTTIGAAVFHFRVRNGNGWGRCAIVTRILRRSFGAEFW
jgi:hypothetical protein